jgi:hypothetical protein
VQNCYIGAGRRWRQRDKVRKYFYIIIWNNETERSGMERKAKEEI